MSASCPEAAVLDHGDPGAVAARGTLGARRTAGSSTSPQLRKARARRRSLANDCAPGCAGRVLFSREERNRARRSHGGAECASNCACTEVQSRSSRTSQGGDVVRQVLPDVSQNSRKTITGTIKVTVRVEVNPSGKVAAAKLKTAGPSRYFAGLALKAAQRWEFSPPQVNGQPAASTWLLQFRFKRAGTQASYTNE